MKTEKINILEHLKKHNQTCFQAIISDLHVENIPNFIVLNNKST